MDFSSLFGTELPRLEGERLVLRAIRPSDVPALFEVFGDERVIEYWSSPALRDLEAARNLAAQIAHGFETRQLFQWAIAGKSDDRLVGTTTLLGLDPDHGHGEVGVALGHGAWGVGLGREALDVLFEFAFGTLGLHRIEADVDPENERSMRLFEGLGFQREGYLRERWWCNGEWRDGVFLGLLRAEWKRP